MLLLLPRLAILSLYPIYRNNPFCCPAYGGHTPLDQLTRYKGLLQEKILCYSLLTAPPRRHANKIQGRQFFAFLAFPRLCERRRQCHDKHETKQQSKYPFSALMVASIFRRSLQHLPALLTCRCSDKHCLADNTYLV